MEYLFVGIGGIFGAVSRYGISKWVGGRWRGDFPLATFCINITGSFMLGLLSVLFTKGGASPAWLKPIATTGFMGAYTTYSTFAFEIINLIQDGENGIAVRYLLGSVILGLLAAWLGLTLGEYV
ncbi:fluoride efflux transporter CrcB [Thermincola potens]|uniref:Fluoride-specific ion channel FluC n=1 Tax=Thermincola potens (strain JR) TaxID=635013 RepID=D5XBR1_THEPJ|nr:fluoride efflux transporter CrcB [Thermincola potens]ADG81459.1 CrcB protein [Thermincola potens JR]